MVASEAHIVGVTFESGDEGLGRVIPDLDRAIVARPMLHQHPRSMIRVHCRGIQRTSTDMACRSEGSSQRN